MLAVNPNDTPAAGAYSIRGSLLEACSCIAPCPCWVGDDPDGGSCDSFNAYLIESGHIRGVDVSGLTLVSIAQIPGNVLAGHWRQVMILDAAGSDEQRRLLFELFTGALGGPVADLAALIGERVAVLEAPIEHRVRGGEGTIRVGRPEAPGELVEASMRPFRDAWGNVTTMHNTRFSTIPGEPAYVAKAYHHAVRLPEYGMVWAFDERNAIQGSFKLEG